MHQHYPHDDLCPLYRRPWLFSARWPPLLAPPPPSFSLGWPPSLKPHHHRPSHLTSCALYIGPKYVGPIHGRVLLASSAAALAGPSILLSLRSKSEMSAIQDLVAKVDPARFQQVFSAGVEDAQALIEVSRGFSFAGGGC